jgi:PAS domain S-box-containing protein
MSDPTDIASLIVSQVNDAIVAIDANERVLLWNPAAERLYGVLGREVVGRSVHDVYSWRWLSPDAEATARRALRDAGEWRGENVHVLRSGREINVESHVSVLRDARGGEQGLLAVIQDVSERKRAERERADNDARLRVALGNIEMAVFSQDRDLRYTWVYKPQLVEASDVIGKSDFDIAERFRLRGLDEVIAVKRRVLETGVGTRTEIQLGEGADARWYDLTVEAIRAPSGGVEGLIASSLEITDHKRSELSLRESREQLRALAARLQTVREEEKRRIARDLHDELGQYLTALRIELRTLEAAISAHDPENALSLLDRVVAASHLVDETTATVRRIAVELRPGVLDRLGLVPTLRDEARRFRERTGIACAVDLPVTPPPLPPEHATALYRICQEALTNVCRHAAASHVEIRLRLGPGQVELEVSDDGRGFDAAAVAGARSVGLVGMAERARSLGGEVSFRRRPEGGTVVTAVVPMSAWRRCGEAVP